MSKKNLLFLALMLALALSACTRAASTGPQPTATLDANFPQPVATTGMNIVEQAGTQTAIATMGVSGQPVATEVSVAIASFTPSAGVDQTPVVIQPTTAPGVAVLPTVTPGAPAVAPTSGPAPTSYTLKGGEFPYCIARRFNLNVAELLRLNGLSLAQANDLPVGYTLKIPQGGAKFDGARALKAHPASHTVTAGETIYSVACLYGDVEPMSIASANNLASPYTLTVGAQIQIP